VAWSAGIVVAILVASYSSFAATDKGLEEDFELAVEGRQIGDLLNVLADPSPPDVGVIPAGGIAVTYHAGWSICWVSTAGGDGHASGRRTGMVGHSAFNLDVF